MLVKYKRHIKQYQPGQHLNYFLSVQCDEHIVLCMFPYVFVQRKLYFFQGDFYAAIPDTVGTERYLMF